MNEMLSPHICESSLPRMAGPAYKARDDGIGDHNAANYAPGALTNGAAGQRCWIAHIDTSLMPKFAKDA